MKLKIITIIILLLASAFLVYATESSITANVIVQGDFITINSPVENFLYGGNSIFVNVSLPEPVKFIYYSYDGARYTKLCKDCSSYSGLRKVAGGNINLIIKAEKYDGSYEYGYVSFRMDGVAPKILWILPNSNSVVSSPAVFSVGYNEDNLRDIILYYGLNLEKSVSLLGCQSGASKECSININLTEHNGQDIYYQFAVSDSYRTTFSKTTNIKVDSSPEPQIFSGSAIITNKRVSPVSYIGANLKSAYLYLKRILKIK